MTKSVPKPNSSSSLIVQDSESTPALVASSGPAAKFAWEEFIYGKIRNPNTRDAYERAIRRFLIHAENLGRELCHISPRDIGVYLDGLNYAPSTKKLHLSALRHFFDTLVLRHVVVLNPAASVRGERLEVVEGATPEITIRQARHLVQSIDISTAVGLRDKAVIAILIYTTARVGAVAKLRYGDYCDDGEQFSFRFREKRGKSREIPVRHDLQRFLSQYIQAAEIEGSEKTSPLFRTTLRRTGRFTNNGMTTNDIRRMLKRRLRAAGLPNRLSPHSFRVATITDLLTQNVPLEDVQNLAGHKDPRTTRLYDRRKRKVTRNIVERITI